MEITLIIDSLAKMNKLAKLVAEHLGKGDVIGLKGDLGSGKTTFTKFMAKAMGIGDNVNSPTFTILKIYQGELPLYHMDVYRLEDAGYDFELEEYIYGEGVSVIEWYPYIESMLPEAILSLEIQFIDAASRQVTVRGEGKYARIVETIGNRYGD